MRDLEPVFIANSRQEYDHGMESFHFEKLKKIQDSLISKSLSESFSTKGFCICCNKSVQLIVDMKWGGQLIDGKSVPNWRERLECPNCHMNNRQRLIATLVKQYFKEKSAPASVYFMEQVTPIFNWSQTNFPNHKIIGSEYLGWNYKSGDLINGIRHEDVLNLSFESESLDLIVSNDVFEHVPDVLRAFKECARVLKPDGVMLVTIPFYSSRVESVERARFDEKGELVHFLEPQFHGNPVSNEGALVFIDFGWDVLNILRSVGFSETGVEVYSSERYGHLGGGQIVFRVSKNKHIKSKKENFFKNLKKLFR